MMFQSLDFYNPAALDAAGHLTSPSRGRCLCNGTGQWRGGTVHKAIWQGTIPPPHPVGRKTKALVHAYARWRDACWLQVSSSSTASVPAPPDMALIPLPPHPAELAAAPAFSSLSTPGKGHILLDLTHYCKKNLFPSIYNPPLKPLGISY